MVSRDGIDGLYGEFHLFPSPLRQDGAIQAEGSDPSASGPNELSLRRAPRRSRFVRVIASSGLLIGRRRDRHLCLIRRDGRSFRWQENTPAPTPPVSINEGRVAK